MSLKPETIDEKEDLSSSNIEEREVFNFFDISVNSLETSSRFEAELCSNCNNLEDTD